MDNVSSIKQKRQERIVQSARDFLDDIVSGNVSEEELDRRRLKITKDIQKEQERGEECMVAEKLYTPDQLAEHLNKSKKTIMQYLRAGKIHGVKLGNEWRVRERDLQAFIDGLDVTGKEG